MATLPTKFLINVSNLLRATPHEREENSVMSIHAEGKMPEYGGLPTSNLVPIKNEDTAQFHNRVITISRIRARAENRYFDAHFMSPHWRSRGQVTVKYSIV